MLGPNAWCCLEGRGEADCHNVWLWWCVNKYSILRWLLIIDQMNAWEKKNNSLIFLNIFEVSPFWSSSALFESSLSKNKEIRNRKVVAHSIEDTAFSLWWKSYVKQNAQWRLMDPEQVHALLPKCFVWQINFPITRWGEKWCGLIAPPDFVSRILFDGWID